MTDWWQNAGLGLFIHFGLYSLLGGEYKGQKMDYIGEWIQAKYRIPNAEYAELAKKFSPEKFNADEYIKLAYEAGCRYIVFTAKHHEGFCNFRTEYSDFSIWNYQKRDLVRELADACRKYNVRLGLYYSQDLDWQENNGGGYNTELSNYGMSWCNDWDFPNKNEKDFDSYFYGKAIPQIKELLTNYGDVSLIWFDCPLDIDPEKALFLRDTVKSLQPDCLINSRICRDGKTGCDYFGLGDNALAGKKSKNRQESAITLNDTWGYKSFDHNWKTAKTVINILSDSVSNNTNLLINVGPKGDGSWPKEATDIFRELAEWMKINSVSVHGNSYIECPESEDYSLTKNKDRIYVHFKKNTEYTEISNIISNIDQIKVLGGRYRISWSQEKDPETGLNPIKINTFGNTETSVLEIIGNNIEFNDCITEEKGIIILPAEKGILSQAGKTDRTGSIIGPAGEIYSGETKINEQGVLTNWFNTDICVTWNFILKYPGNYNVTAITSAVYHQAQWKGGHTVHLETEHSVCPKKEIKNDGFIKEAGEIYRQAKTDLGIINLNKKGLNSVTLKADNIISDTPGLALVKIIFSKIKQ